MQSSLDPEDNHDIGEISESNIYTETSSQTHSDNSHTMDVRYRDAQLEISKPREESQGVHVALDGSNGNLDYSKPAVTVTASDASDKTLSPQLVLQPEDHDLAIVALSRFA